MVALVNSTGTHKIELQNREGSRKKVPPMLTMTRPASSNQWVSSQRKRSIIGKKIRSSW